MSLFTITGLSISVLCVTLAIGILIYAKDQTHYLWAYFNLAIFTWSIGTFFVGISKTPHNAELAWRWAYGFGSFVPSIFYHFIYSFCELKKKTTLKIIYSVGLIFTPICFFAPNFINKIDYIFNSIYYHKATLLFSLFMIYLNSVVYLSFNELLKYLKTAKGKKRTQVLYILYGFGIGWGGGITTFLPPYNVPIYPAWHFTICLYILMMTYAIFKHHLMDINIIIRRSLIYSLLVTAITLIFLISVLISEHLFHQVIHYQNIAASIITASLIALIFTPLKNKIQDIVDRSFFKATPMEMADQNEKLKAVATLASGLAHEIKNPLTTLKTFAEYVPLKKDDSEFMKQYQKIMPQEISRIDNLVRELLFFAKPSPPQMQTVNPNEIISNLTLMLEQKFKSSNIHLDAQLNANTFVQADSNQIKQALLNLILNAIDAMPNGGTLTIATSAIPAPSTKGRSPKGQAGIQNNQYIIEISDTGCGIDTKDLPHIFEPFFTKKEKGTGLGLAITKGIIEKHGGTLEVKSKIEQGSTFRIKIFYESI